MTAANFIFFARTDLTVLGEDPENADMSNPRGEIVGYASYVVAEEVNSGRRFLHFVKTGRWEDTTLAPAEKLASALTNRLANLGKLPVAFDRWEETFARYGSPAGQDQEHEEAIAERM